MTLVRMNIMRTALLVSCAILSASAELCRAEPIVLKSNAISGSGIIPLLPPDTMTIDISEPSKSVTSIKPSTTSKSKQLSAKEAKPTLKTIQDLQPVQDKNPSTTILARSAGSIGIKISHITGVDTISLQTTGQTPKYSVQRLSNPARLVVDVEAEKIKASRKMSVSDLNFISAIRLGAHSDRSRVVLDLSDDRQIQHEVLVINGSIVVTLRGIVAPEQVSVVARSSKPDAAQKLENDKTAVEGLENEEATASKTFADIVSDQKIDRDVGTELSVAAADAKAETILAAVVPAKGAAPTEITKLSLENGQTLTGQVAVAIAGKPNFSLQRSAPSEYVLTLKGSTLSDTVTKGALFSDSPKSVIRSARPIVAGKDVLVRIFSQPSAYLTAREHNGAVIVEETHDLARVVSDIRAQLAPPDKKDEKELKNQKNEKVQKDKNEPKAETNQKGKQAEVVAKNPDTDKKPVVVKVKGKNTVGGISEADLDALLGDKSSYSGRLISLDLQDTDIDNALRIIAEVSNLNIVASEEVSGKVTLRLLDVPWDQALDVILRSNGLDKVLEGNVMRIASVEKLRVERENLKHAQDAEEELEPIGVKYLRVSYAKAAEMKILVETVLSERGSVAYDERSNQIIVKDVRNGLKNVVELVSKLDLRTPQVLLETQIVEASRNLSRELGSELGFQYIQSPSTGNGTGLNFPSSVSLGGSAVPSTITGSSFPVAASAAGGSAVSMLFGSADGTKSLEFRLSQLEQEGRIRIISRPAVATTNNKAAEIKSVEKFRVKLPNGGLSVATGSGAQANGAGATATEVIEAGITLNVTPQASPDYFILLDIKAKSSTFGSKEVDNIPNEFERSASSTVLVSSGQTFALGGIYKITEGDRISGVPFFKDIPVLGTFFRRSVVDDSDEELLFFITPRIVEGSFDDASMKAAS